MAHEVANRSSLSTVYLEVRGNSGISLVNIAFL